MTVVNMQEQSLGTLNCMDMLYCTPPLASGNIMHPCNSRYLWKIFLYIDHNHMEYLYNIPCLIAELHIYYRFNYYPNSYVKPYWIFCVFYFHFSLFVSFRTPDILSTMTSKYVSRDISCIMCLTKENAVLNF